MKKLDFKSKYSQGLPGGPNELNVSIEGYKITSSDRFNPFNIIPSGNITMKDVPHPVFGIDNLGNSQMMMPGMNYQFPGSEVFELPIRQTGGDTPEGRGKNVYVKMPDGDVKYLNTSSEEYRELYGSGNLASTTDGDTYYFPDLPELKVEANRRDWLGEGADAMRAFAYSPFAATAAAMQVPQSLLVEGVEALRGNPYDFKKALDVNLLNRNVNNMFDNKQRTPGEVWGYENPEGFLQHAVNFGLDMIDPNLVTGVAGTIGKQAIKKGLKKGISKTASSNDFLQKSYKRNPSSKEIDNAILFNKNSDLDITQVDDAFSREMNQRVYDSYAPDLTRSRDFILKEGNKEFEDYMSEEGLRRARLAFKKANPNLTASEIDNLVSAQLTELSSAFDSNMAEYMLQKPELWTNLQNPEHLKFLNKMFPTDNAWAWHNPQMYEQLTGNPGWGKIENVRYPDSGMPSLLSHSQKGNRPLRGKYNNEPLTQIMSEALDEFAKPFYGMKTMAIGKDYIGHVPTHAHEVGHIMQRDAMHPVDVELQTLVDKTPLQRLWNYGWDITANSHKKRQDYRNAFDYFYNPSGRKAPNEGYPFARETRESMLEKGIIKSRFEEITPAKLLKFRLSNPFSMANEHRLVSIVPPWKYKGLSKIMNDMNVATPIVGGGLGYAGYQGLPENQSSNTTYKEGGEYEELELDDDAIKFYKNQGYTVEVLDNDYDKYQFPGNQVFEIPIKNEEYYELELTDEEIEQYKLSGYIVEELPTFQEGGDIITEYGWDYKKEGDKYLTKKTNNTEWIEAKGKALDAIKTQVYGKQFLPQDSHQNENTLRYKEPLKNKVDENLQEGYLPTFHDYSESEICIKGKGCSFNASKKMLDILETVGIKNDDVWAEDAWFNRSDKINKGGTLIYDTKERDLEKMSQLPKSLWSKLKVGDYVHLNRSGETYDEKTKEGYNPKDNEKIEHLGFIIGKDKDGTPLIWHGSAKGNAYIQRIDEKIYLPDNEDLGDFKIASVVRSKSLSEKSPEELKKLETLNYYKPFDSNKKLEYGKDLSPTQFKAIKELNNNLKKFKDLGYDQDDVLRVGQLLIGGIMEMESSSGESLFRPIKELGAIGLKDVFGVIEGEASRGVYQLKDKFNFTDKDGNLNVYGKKLAQLGVDINDIHNNLKNETLAGTVLLLENYNKLKKDKNYNIETDLYQDKYPANYILAKGWNVGSEWYKKDKYKNYLDDFDITYSNKVIDLASEKVKTNANTNLNRDKKIIKEQQNQRVIDNFSNEKDIIDKELQQKKQTIEDLKYRTIPESTYVNQPNISLQKKPIPFKYQVGGNILPRFQTQGEVIAETPEPNYETTTAQQRWLERNKNDIDYRLTKDYRDRLDNSGLKPNTPEWLEYKNKLRDFENEAKTYEYSRKPEDVNLRALQPYGALDQKRYENLEVPAYGSVVEPEKYFTPFPTVPGKVYDIDVKGNTRELRVNTNVASMKGNQYKDYDVKPQYDKEGKLINKLGKDKFEIEPIEGSNFVLAKIPDKRLTTGYKTTILPASKEYENDWNTWMSKHDKTMVNTLSNEMFPAFTSATKPGVGLYSKQLGGSSEENFIETELDDSEIEYYKSLGYKIEVIK